MRKILCLSTDPEQLRALSRAAIAAGAEPLEVTTVSRALRLARVADAAVASGEQGLALLERLALDRPALPRVALFCAQSVDELFALFEASRPFAVLRDPPDQASLADALRRALESASLTPGETTTRRPLPGPPVGFARLITDPPTGAHGYHYFKLRLEEELDRATRYHRPLSLVLVDVDDLRAINDRHGRAVGDLLLKQVAGALIHSARTIDRVGRWSGGCFALVLPETPVGAAYGIAERFRSEIAGRRFVIPSRPDADPVRATVSCGVASALRDGALHTATLLLRADAALRDAKERGRNRSVADR